MTRPRLERHPTGVLHTVYEQRRGERVMWTVLDAVFGIFWLLVFCAIGAAVALALAGALFGIGPAS